MNERVAVAGSGAIACGLAVVAAARLGESVLVARSEDSADRARKQTAKLLERMESDANVVIGTDHGIVEDATVIIEAIAEDLDHKAALLRDLNEAAHDHAILGTTTSSLSVQELAEASCRPERFVGFHVFNPVPRMQLIEVAYTDRTDDAVRGRVEQLVTALGKTYVEVPDTPGFVVNRLLFPMLFDAVRLLDEADGVLTAETIDECMKLGAGHPMGPLALLDYVGLDVSIAIGEQIGIEIPQRCRRMADEGALGRKAGRGFFTY